MEWYKLAKIGKKPGSKALKEFLENYSEGELVVFEETVAKVEASKKAAIFTTIVDQRKIDKKNPKLK